MKKIIRNIIKCNTCGDVIESTYRHDFKSCSCGRVAVDGGHDYLRRGFIESQNDFTDLSEFEEGSTIESRKNDTLKLKNDTLNDT